MIQLSNIDVSANFDSGTFLGSFSVYKDSESYDSSDNSIQDYYKLTFEDFTVLEVVIAIAVEKYLKKYKSV